MTLISKLSQGCNHWFNRNCKGLTGTVKWPETISVRQNICLNQSLRTKTNKDSEQNVLKVSKIKQLRKIKRSEPRKFLHGSKKSAGHVSADKCYEFLRTPTADKMIMMAHKTLLKHVR